MDGRMKTDTRHLTGFLGQQYQTICLKTIVKMVSRLRTWKMTQVLHESGALTLTVSSLCQYVHRHTVFKKTKTDKSSDAYQHWVVTFCDYHRLRSAHCCNDNQQSQWENGNFDPCRSETPQNFITKNAHFDYVMRCYMHAIFHGNWPKVVHPTSS